jgi:hypothetical protein
MSKPKRSAKRTRAPVAKRALPKKKAAVAKKKTASPRKSASKPATVDAYVKTLPPQTQQIVNKLRALVAEASPEVTETFKWAQPVYEANGPFAYIKAHKGHVNFGFWRGAAFTEPNVKLEGDGSRMRHLKITSMADIDDKVFKTLIQVGVLLNTQLGNPTRR